MQVSGIYSGYWTCLWLLNEHGTIEVLARQPIIVHKFTSNSSPPMLHIHEQLNLS